MRFVEFLKTTVILSAGAATALAVATVIGASTQSEPSVPLLAAAWWVLAAALGLALGRRAETTPPIARLLAGARAATALPEQRPARILVNRLWPLLASTLVATVLGFLFPQISGTATGFAIIWALAWRKQHRAVEAIERRDGVSFHVDPTSPVRPMTLTRTPGFKAYLPQQHERAA